MGIIFQVDWTILHNEKLTQPELIDDTLEDDEIYIADCPRIQIK